MTENLNEMILQLAFVLTAIIVGARLVGRAVRRWAKTIKALRKKQSHHAKHTVSHQKMQELFAKISAEILK